MKNINVVVQGLMFSHSGFAEATRNIAYELSKDVNVKCFVMDDDNIDILKTKKGKRIKQLQNKTINVRPIWITMTHLLGIPPNCGYSIGYGMFETEKFPDIYVRNLEKQDEIWTPSTFNQRNMTEAGLRNVHTMPLGVDLQRFNYKKVKPMVLKDCENKFVFLSIMGWSARKGVDLLIKGFCEEFTGNDLVVLYLKGGWYDENLAKMEVMKETMKHKNPPKIILDFKIYNNSDLPKLYQACNCFVLPSRGEGWGLNYTEAIAMKKPVIATRWSSQLDYLNDRNSYLVDLDTREPLKTCPACDWICVEYYGERFANPSLQSLRKQLRRVYGSRNEVGRRTEQAYQDIKKYTWQKSAKRMLERIIEIDKDLIKFETRI